MNGTDASKINGVCGFESEHAFGGTKQMKRPMTDAKEVGVGNPAEEKRSVIGRIDLYKHTMPDARVFPSTHDFSCFFTRAQGLLDKPTPSPYKQAHMKKLLLTVIVAAFAVAAQAGNDKSCADKDSAGCCAKSKVSTSTEAKGECCMAKAAAGTCPFKAKVASKSTKTHQALLSPKAVSIAG